MKHPNLIFTIKLELAIINGKIAKLKPIDAINRKTHKKYNMLKSEYEHGLRIIELMDDI